MTGPELIERIAVVEVKMDALLHAFEADREDRRERQKEHDRLWGAEGLYVLRLQSIERWQTKWKGAAVVLSLLWVGLTAIIGWVGSWPWPSHR